MIKKSQSLPNSESSALQSQIIFSSGFEHPSPLQDFLNMRAGVPGFDSIGPWTVGGNVDWLGYYYAPFNGNGSIDLSGDAAGSISTLLDTQAGSSYLLAFAMAGNMGGGNTVKSMRVKVGDVDRTVTFDTSGTTGTSPGWKTVEIPFIATIDRSLTFTSLEDNYYGPLLDDVSVADNNQPRIIIDSPNNLTVAPGERIAIPLTYSLSTGDKTARDLQLSLYFDSSRLTFDSFGSASNLAAPTYSVEADTSNTDSESNTDKVLTMSWTGASSSAGQKGFPALDSLTGYPILIGAPIFQGGPGFAGNTQVHLRSSSTHEGEIFIGDSITIFSNVNSSGQAQSMPWSLDIDGSGVFDLDTDARMLLRHALGTFPDDSLVKGALSQSSSRIDSSAILRELDRGISSLAADIDGNGKCEAFSDSILAMAYGMGAITPEALLPPALFSPGATRLENASLLNYLHSIDPGYSNSR